MQAICACERLAFSPKALADLGTLLGSDCSRKLEECNVIVIGGLSGVSLIFSPLKLCELNENHGQQRHKDDEEKGGQHPENASEPRVLIDGDSEFWPSILDSVSTADSRDDTDGDRPENAEQHGEDCRECVSSLHAGVPQANVVPENCDPAAQGMVSNHSRAAPEWVAVLRKTGPATRSRMVHVPAATRPNDAFQHFRSSESERNKSSHHPPCLGRGAERVAML